MTLPNRTPEQRQQALRKAVPAGTARKQLEAIARGQQTLPAVLERAKSDPVIGKTRVAALLKSLPGYGPAKVAALMEQTGIIASRRAAGLSEQQRRRLCDALT